MRWSLLLLGIVLAVTLPFYPRVDGRRVVREDSETKGLLQKIFDAIMGDDTDTDNKETDDQWSTVSTTMISTSPTISTISTTTSASSTSTEKNEEKTQASSKTVETTKTKTTAAPEKNECDTPRDLTQYCKISDEIGSYLQWDTSFGALVGKVFSANVIDQLLKMCRPGSWCLSDVYINNFSENMGNFFSSPICDVTLQECLDNILYYRAGCSNMLNVSVLSDSLTLLCEMYGISEVTPDCFGHTIATLHVTLADEIRVISKDIDNDGEFCLGPYVGMSRKFLCTLEKCPQHQSLFDDFVPWKWFMQDAPTIKEVCQLESVCGDVEQAQEEGETTAATFYTTLPTSTEEVQQQTEGQGSEVQKNKKPIFIIQASDDSTRFMVGVVTGVLIGVLGLMILVAAVCKRMRKRNRFSTKDGYSKLHNEEVD